MQFPNPVFYEYVVVVLAMLYWGWRCFSLEVRGRDKIFRWTTNFWLVVAVVFFFLLGLAFPMLGWEEAIAMFYALYAMPFLLGLIAFNMGYWVHVVADVVNSAPRVG